MAINTKFPTALSSPVAIRELIPTNAYVTVANLSVYVHLVTSEDPTYVVPRL